MTTLPDYNTATLATGYIWRAGMRTSSTSAHSGIPRLISQGSTGTFDPVTGYSPGSNAALKLSLTDIEANRLREQGIVIGFTVDLASIDQAVSVIGTRWLVSNDVGGVYVRQASAIPGPSAPSRKILGVAIDGEVGAPPAEIYIAADDKNTFVQITISCAYSSIYVWVDSLLVMILPRTRVLPKEAYKNWYIGGDGSTSDTYSRTAGSIKDVFLLAGVSKVSSTLNSVGIFGNSFHSNTPPAPYMASGSYKVVWHPGTGYQSDGVTPVVASTTTDSTGNYRGDTGFSCQVFRGLAMSGINPTNNVNAAVSGGSVDNASTSKVTGLNKLRGLVRGGFRPEALVSGFGTNECAASTFDACMFEAGYKQFLKEAYLAGVKYVLIQNVISLGNDSATYSAPKYATAVLDANAIISGLPGWASQHCKDLRIRIDDVYTAFGGASPTSGLFVTSNVHPNAVGTSKLGLSAGVKLAELIVS